MNITMEINTMPERQHVLEFLSNLTDADSDELCAANAGAALDTVTDKYMDALEGTEVFIMRSANGDIAAMGGITGKRDNGNARGVWLQCTDKAASCAKTIFKTCANALKKSPGIYAAIVYEQNAAHVRFVTRGLGFRRVSEMRNDFALYILDNNGGTQCAE